MDVAPSSASPSVIRSTGHGRDRNPPAEGVLSIAVVVATTGRPRTSRLTVERLARQSRPADRLLVVGVTSADVAEMDAVALPVEVCLASRGLCRQRNHALRVLDGDCDLVIFFDDDFLACDDYLQNVERMFRDEPDIVGATGRVVADGANGPGLTFHEAEVILEAGRAEFDGSAPARSRRALYGCNMAFRASAIAGMSFDENLPLYGWQEDVDFSFRLGARGRVVESGAFGGVHMGEKIGRTSGRRLGYSQIANPMYLLKKNTLPRNRAFKIMRNNFAVNLWRSPFPEPYIDRRGRLIGNLIALGDLIVGRLHPGRILDMPG